MSKVKLQSSDGQIIEVDADIMKCSVFLEPIMESIDDGNDVVVPLPTINFQVLEKVVEWATYHRNDPPVGPTPEYHGVRPSDDISSWDANFLKVEPGILFELILAADYLNIEALKDTTCKTVANMIKGKSPEEICQTFRC